MPIIPSDSIDLDVAIAFNPSNSIYYWFTSNLQVPYNPTIDSITSTDIYITTASKTKIPFNRHNIEVFHMCQESLDAYDDFVTLHGTNPTISDLYSYNPSWLCYLATHNFDIGSFTGTITDQNYVFDFVSGALVTQTKGSITIHYSYA